MIVISSYIYRYTTPCIVLTLDPHDVFERKTNNLSYVVAR